MSAIGDIIMASGILPALKKAYPTSHITWVAQREYIELLSDSPYVDQVISFDRKGLSKLLKQGTIIGFLRQLLFLIKEIRKKHYEIVLDLQGIWKSSIWAVLSRSGNKIVVDPKEGVGFLFSKKIYPNPKDKRIGAEYKLALEFLQVVENNYTLGVGINRSPVDIQGEYVVFCPFTTRQQKFWIDNYWREVQDFVHKKGYKVVILGGKQDRELFNKIFSSRENLIDLVGKLSLKESIGIIKGASAVIGVDTGLTHCGMLMKRPTIAIFGSTCPYLDTGYSKGIVLYENLDCSPCKRNPKCRGNFECMHKITPSKVIEYLEDWLGR